MRTSKSAGFDSVGKESRVDPKKESTKRKEEAMKNTKMMSVLALLSTSILMIWGCGERGKNPLSYNESDLLEFAQPEETGDESGAAMLQPPVPEEHPWEQGGLTKVGGDSYSNEQPPPMYKGYHVVCSMYCWMGFDGIWRCSRECVLVRDEVWPDQK